MKKLLLFLLCNFSFVLFSAHEQEAQHAQHFLDTLHKTSFFMKNEAQKKAALDTCLEHIKKICLKEELDYEKVLEKMLNLITYEVAYYEGLDKDRHYGVGLSMLAASAFFGICSYFVYPRGAREKKALLEQKMYEKQRSAKGISYMLDEEYADLVGQWRKIYTHSEGTLGCGIIAVSCAFTGLLALYDKKYGQYYYQKYSFIKAYLESYVQLFPSNLRKDLIVAIKAHDSVAVKACIERGADINSKDDKEYTPLYYAAELGDRAIVELLIAHGAEAKIATKYGITPYNRAFDGGHVAVCEFLKEQGGYAVIDAVHCGDIQELEHYLIHEGKNVQENMQFLFAKAVCRGNSAVLELLLQHGADVNSSFDAFTPLGYATMARNVGTIEFLIKHGADIHARGSGGWQPIHAAMVFPNLEVVKTLIAAGAFAQSQTIDGSTPLKIILTLWCSNPKIPCDEETEKVVTYLRSLI